MRSGYLVNRCIAVGMRSLRSNLRHSGLLDCSCKNCSSFWSLRCRFLSISKACDWLRQKMAEAVRNFSPASPLNLLSKISAMFCITGFNFFLALNSLFNALCTCMISSRFGNNNLTRSKGIHDSCFMGARKTLCMTLRLRTWAFSVWINSATTSCRFFSFGLSLRSMSFGMIVSSGGNSISASKSESS
ncbi:hypothetical protein NP493_418g01013 [Ridgeia piscesae]|uniref:Uncharacterized protein n=1 Tax=Ridgeia piscesae TaxID=27915 RepID=A0AAD9L1G1_RIDPI|nr:hypothetical protein NP493_418g01013 [Ridgeia piscesae]